MPSFRLEYDNNGDVQEFSFDGDSVSIGRDKSSDFVLDHPTVSRQHAIIVHKGGRYHLVVVSRGGLTALDGEQVQGEVGLFDGSKVRLGKLAFRFRSLDAPQKPAGNTSQQYSGGGLGAAQSSPQQTSGFGGWQMSAGLDGMQGGQNPQTGGFSPSGGADAGGFGPGGNQAGQAARADQGGYGGGQQGGFGGGQQGGYGGGQQGGYGFGDSPASGMGADASQGAASRELPPEPAAPAEPADPNDPGIISWDEIASSSEAMDDEDDGPPKEATVYERMNSNKKKQQTNPALVAVAGAAIVGLLWFTFFDDTGGKAGPTEQAKPVEEQEPVEIEVSCMGESACFQKAKESYRVGLEKLEKKDAAVVNLFTGYKKLLETEAFLEKAGRAEIPPEMNKLEASRDASREELTTLFRNYRVKYHRAKKRNQHRVMAQALDAIKTYFPDKTAREHKWANRAELDMKKKGIYPKHVYPPR